MSLTSLIKRTLKQLTPWGLRVCWATIGLKGGSIAYPPWFFSRWIGACRCRESIGKRKRRICSMNTWNLSIVFFLGSFFGILLKLCYFFRPKKKNFFFFGDWKKKKIFFFFLATEKKKNFFLKILPFSHFFIKRKPQKQEHQDDFADRPRQKHELQPRLRWEAD